MLSLQGRVLIKMSTKADTARDAGLTIPEEIVYERGIPYGPDAQYQDLDICYPSEHSEKLPVIVSVHGGGYVYGSTSVYQFYCADLARRGFAVVNFNYRLAPKYRYPAPLEDLNSVFTYLLSDACVDKYPVDTDRIFLLGDSAGAQIASQYAAMLTNPEYQKCFDFTLPSFTIRGLGLNCGIYDMMEQIKGTRGRGVMKDYLGSLAKVPTQDLDVLSYITGDYPPAYLITAQADSMKPFAKPMQEFLQKKGVRCECEIYGDETTYHVFHCNVRSEVGQKANDDQCAFFKSLL
ncbi:MAG: alpha/beta hydrolase [Lachnospiraceae bacterium]|nr:alpha/beta hydrolase [Lachnospiraceae bacterium]